MNRHIIVESLRLLSFVEYVILPWEEAYGLLVSFIQGDCVGKFLRSRFRKKSTHSSFQIFCLILSGSCSLANNPLEKAAEQQLGMYS